MTTRSLLFALSLAPTLAASSAASAQDAAPTSGELVQVPRVCAEIDDAALDPAAREREKHILERVLERAEMFVVDRDCSEVYRASHDTTNGRLHVRLEGPRAVVNGTAESTAQLGDVYAMMIVDQLAARAEAEARVVALQQRVARKFAESSTSDDAATEPAGTSEGSPAEPRAIERPTVASMAPIAESDPDAPPPATAPSTSGHLYGRAGVGTVGTLGPGLALAGGYRVPIAPNTMLDASISTLSSGMFGLTAEVFGVTAPSQAQSGISTVYGGGGLSFSTTENGGGGAGLELTGGVSINRLFVQTDLSLPFYSTLDGYPAAFSVSLGFTR